MTSGVASSFTNMLVSKGSGVPGVSPCAVAYRLVLLSKTIADPPLLATFAATSIKGLTPW